MCWRKNGGIHNWSLTNKGRTGKETHQKKSCRGSKGPFQSHGKAKKIQQKQKQEITIIKGKSAQIKKQNKKQAITSVGVLTQIKATQWTLQQLRN